jgi:hypothetical protein
LSADTETTVQINPDQAINDLYRAITAVMNPPTTLPFTEGNAPYVFSETLRELAETEKNNPLLASRLGFAAKVYRYASSVSDQIQDKAGKSLTAVLEGVVPRLAANLVEHGVDRRFLEDIAATMSALYMQGVVAGAATVLLSKQGLLDRLDEYE